MSDSLVKERVISLLRVAGVLVEEADRTSRRSAAKPELVDDKASPTVAQLYQSMVGSVMYAMIQTRPDICYAVTILS